MNMKTQRLLYFLFSLKACSDFIYYLFIYVCCQLNFYDLQGALYHQHIKTQFTQSYGG